MATGAAPQKDQILIAATAEFGIVDVVVGQAGFIDRINFAHEVMLAKTVESSNHANLTKVIR